MKRVVAAYLGALVCIAWAVLVAWAHLRRRRRLLCNLGLHHWHLITTAWQGFVKFECCSRGCGAVRTRRGRNW